MEKDKPLLESEFRKIFVAQFGLMLDMLVTIGTLNAVLADQGVLPLDKMKEARRIVENLPKVVALRQLASEIQDPASILELLKNFQGPIQ
jgi:hypothetical protein